MGFGHHALADYRVLDVRSLQKIDSSYNRYIPANAVIIKDNAFDCRQI